MFHYGLGLAAAQFDNIARLLKLYGCEGAMCIISEDATASLARLEAIIEDGAVLLYGLNGAAQRVSCLLCLMGSKKRADHGRCNSAHT